MKTVIRLFLVTLMALFIGCGGDSTASNSNDNPPNDSDVELSYDYNADKSASMLLDAQAVNQYLDVQDALTQAKTDKAEFDSILAGFIGSLFVDSESIDTIPSYAPRGAMKSKTVGVTNGSIDYSEYILKADIDLDNSVNLNDLDLLSTALFHGYESSEYDVNSDGKFNSADMVYLIAHFSSMIASYDFYSTDGNKLDIPSRSVDDPRSFTYNGSETEVMVVAKDLNGVSGFTTGLSDIGDAWYKKTGWVLQGEREFRSLKKIREMTDDAFFDAAKFALDNPYFLGWKNEWFYIQINGLKEIYNPLTDVGYDLFINNQESTMNEHFKKTDMKHPAKKIRVENTYSYDIGSHSGEEKVFTEISPIIETYVRDGKTVVISKNLICYEQLFYSEKDKEMDIILSSSDSDTKVKGTVIIERIGPDPKTEEYPVEIIDESGFVTFNSVPFGAFDINYLDECLCRKSINEEYVFEKLDNILEHTIDIEKVSITLELLDKDNNPITGETISLLAKECTNSQEDEKSFDDTTDSSGKVTFDNVPIGDYTVFVADKVNSAINVCDTYVGTLYTDPLWDIDISFTGRFCDYEKSVKKVKIAGINDSLKSWSDAYPFPQELLFDGKLLVDTSYYTGEDYGMQVRYYPNGLTNGMYKGLSIQLEALGDKLNEDKCVGDTWFVDSGDYTWEGINTQLDTTQTAAFYANRAFQIHDTGEWINDNPINGQNPDGFSTLTVTFTPAN